ncbi:hypothetical protein C8R46DRAFT_1357602 [Mycena filopes]|nr:hypothetical protein C8R46DRAFT_1357602 [Mycena filopes]
MQTTSKRRRTDSSGADEPAPPVRSDIWFDDGNIVLQAEDTQFRVYKGTLCNSFDVLKNLVENVEDSKGIEGCPLLLLSDSAIEVGHVLQRMFHPWSYPENTPVPFDVVSAHLRLGRKYAMKPLYDSALARIAFSFPTTLEEFLNSDKNESILFKDALGISRSLGIVVNTVVIVRELDLLHLLPAAFWLLSTTPERLAEDDAGLLLASDKRTFLLAAQPLRVAYADYLFGWLDESVVSSPDCSMPQTCRTAKTRYSLKLWRPPGLRLRISWQPSAEKGLCSSCITVAKKHHRDGQKRLWKELPSFFGLPPWEELLA